MLNYEVGDGIVGDCVAENLFLDLDLFRTCVYEILDMVDHSGVGVGKV